MLTLCEGTCKILCLMDVETILDPSRIRTLKACYLFFICLFLRFSLVLCGFSCIAVHRSLLAVFAFSLSPLTPLCQPYWEQGHRETLLSLSCPSPVLRPRLLFLGFRLISVSFNTILVMLGEPKPFKEVKTTDVNNSTYWWTLQQRFVFPLRLGGIISTII